MASNGADAVLSRTLDDLVLYRKHHAQSFGLTHQIYRLGLRQVSNYILRNRARHMDEFQRNALEAMVDIAIQVHGDQPRKSRALYLTHPLEIARHEADGGAEWEILLTAILHDTGEYLIKHDSEVRTLRERVRSGVGNVMHTRRLLVHRSARVMRALLERVGNTLEELLDTHDIVQPRMRDRYRRRIERVQFGIYQMTRLEGIDEGEYLNRLLYAKRRKTRGEGDIPIWQDLRAFIGDPKEHPFELYTKQIASLKLRDDIANIRETPRAYERSDTSKDEGQYTVAHMNYLTFKYTTVAAAFQSKLRRLRRSDAERDYLEENIDELKRALREENAKDLRFLRRVLTPKERRVVEQNVARYFATGGKTHPHEPRYEWRTPTAAVEAMAAVYRNMLSGKPVADPFFPIEGYTFRNVRMMDGDKRWLETLAHVRDPRQKERGVHLIVYQDALLNQRTFDSPPRHLAYLEAVFSQRWRDAGKFSLPVSGGPLARS